ncbi:MAG: hypothetical protein KDA41_14265, partial [Planctomycetales bacterium]|nr:hypothetical protein [Planctomycetales bacterium]
MANILFAWELGSGWGHLTSIFPLAAGLAQRGHRVVAVVRDMPRAARLFESTAVELLPAPALGRVAENRFQPICTYAHLLYNTICRSESTLPTLLQFWKSLFDRTSPDLLVADHSPAALLAARGGSFGQVAIGTGFSAPAPVAPFPNWRPWLNTPPERLWNDEQLVLHTINQHLAPSVALAALSDLYRDVDDTILMTWPELDPFGQVRKRGLYVGGWPELPGKAPQWPRAEGPRVFAYLRPLLWLPALLEMLGESPYSVIARIPGADAARWNERTPDNIVVENEFLDIPHVARQCDAALCHATHIMTMSLLSAGRPLVMAPP